MQAGASPTQEANSHFVGLSVISVKTAYVPHPFAYFWVNTDQSQNNNKNSSMRGFINLPIDIILT